MWYKAGDEEEGWYHSMFTHNTLSALLSGIKERHTVTLTHTKAAAHTFMSSFIRPPGQKGRGGRKPSERRARGARRESDRDAQTFTRTEESAVSEWIWGGGGRTLPSCPLFEVRHRPYVQNPREGHVYIPPLHPQRAG